MRERRIRPNDATHPRELPDPADEAAYYAHQRCKEIADVQQLPQPVGTWTEGDPCALCHEPEEPEDPIAHFVAPDGSTYVMAHGQCGVDAGLRLA